MRIPRIYTPQPLSENTQIDLNDNAAHHVGKVLRMQAGRKLVLFNGQGPYHFNAVIEHADKKRVSVSIIEKIDTNNESPLHTHVAQALSKGDKMELVIQKAVELGVNEITPLWTEHCDVKLNAERMEKKLKQWHGIIISACEQCGRDLLPTLNPVVKFQDWIAHVNADEKWVLDPRGNAEQTSPETVTSAVIAIGPEGGLSQDEIKQACEQGFKAKLIGPRVLRTETAALTAVTLLQSQWGDF
ncbi:16S rRNA (uracil(1498)-N(3))-methyltransferase [Oceaniserpentilla sp. 4NH20-0058]|uniref:16S rRNA (uracil(1498)-N(3))-methyltransferase n=1 Tax=Oceaniserpentilla sp. 4NH20-0058 TaxID=3127660 RepID=UPI0031061BF5